MKTAGDYIKSLPDLVDKSELKGLQTTFHFDLKGEGGGKYTVLVGDGDISVEEGLTGEPRCKVKGKAEHFMNVVSGKKNPLVAILTGQIAVTNQSELVKYARIFGLMK